MGKDHLGVSVAKAEGTQRRVEVRIGAAFWTLKIKLVMALAGEARAAAVEPESRRGRSELSVLPAALTARAPAERLWRPLLFLLRVFVFSVG